jgi:site-specific DNA-cytosine methylase
MPEKQRFPAVIVRRGACFKPSAYTLGKDGALTEVHPPLAREADKGDQEPLVLAGPPFAVRFLTCNEAERLQAFPDNYTNVPGASNTSRRKALGNSMCVYVMRWIGQQIDFAHYFFGETALTRDEPDLFA